MPRPLPPLLSTPSPFAPSLWRRAPGWRPLPAFTGCCCRCWCFPWRLCRWSPRTGPCWGSWGWRRRARRPAAAASSRWCDPDPSPPRSWWSCAEARSLWWLSGCKKKWRRKEEESGAILEAGWGGRDGGHTLTKHEIWLIFGLILVYWNRWNKKLILRRKRQNKDC